MKAKVVGTDIEFDIANVRDLPFSKGDELRLDVDGELKRYTVKCIVKCFDQRCSTYYHNDSWMWIENIKTIRGG